MELEALLSRPLLAFVAAYGPTVRPVWFAYEEGAFWWLTGSWARLPEILSEHPHVALVIVDCNLATGEIHQVHAQGSAEVVDFDADRARRLLVRYLGPNESSWDTQFREETFGDPSVRFARLTPEEIRMRDLSFTPSDSNA